MTWYNDDATYEANYEMYNQDSVNISYGRADLSNGTGWNVFMCRLKSGKIAVGIERIGFFIFKDKNALLGDGAYRYIGEKLCIPTKSDAIEMVKFFEWFFTENQPNW